MKMEMSEYRKIDALNNSRLKTILKSPYHFKNYSDSEKKSDAMDFGTACHTAILEPHLFSSTVVMIPECDRRTKEGKAIFAEFEAANRGKVALSMEDYNSVVSIRDKVADNVFIQKLLKDCKFEDSFITDTIPKQKIRVDAWKSGMILDVKTTQSGDEREFTSSVLKFGYDFQAAMYCSVMKELFNQDFTFTFICIEKGTNAIAVYDLSPDFIRRGNVQYNKALDLYNRCMDTGSWPEYTNTSIKTLALPAWAEVMEF